MIRDQRLRASITLFSLSAGKFFDGLAGSLVEWLSGLSFQCQPSRRKYKSNFMCLLNVFAFILNNVPSRLSLTLTLNPSENGNVFSVCFCCE